MSDPVYLDQSLFLNFRNKLHHSDLSVMSLLLVVFLFLNRLNYLITILIGKPNVSVFFQTDRQTASIFNDLSFLFIFFFRSDRKSVDALLTEVEEEKILHTYRSC